MRVITAALMATLWAGPAIAQSDDPFGSSDESSTGRAPVGAPTEDKQTTEADEGEAPSTEVQAPEREGEAWVRPPLARDVDESIYVVQRRTYSKKKKFEVTPLVFTSVNNKFVGHAGLAVSAAYHLRENLTVEVLTSLPVPFLFKGFYSGMVYELFDQESQEPEEVDLKRMDYMGALSLQFSALYGKFDVYGQLVDYDFYASVGFGMTSTRERCSPLDDGGCEAEPGRDDTGTRSPADISDRWRPSGHLGAGLRLFFRDWIGLRVEGRNVVYSDRASLGGVSTDIRNHVLIFTGVSFLL